jgi:MoaA/NifB/PqqE/SkfB family radical SAM enzyme
MKAIQQLASLPRRWLRYRRYRPDPVWATFDVTWNCNCRCAYCGYWKDRHTDLSTDRVKAVIDNLKRLGLAYLGLSGGEPLLRQDIVELVSYARSRGLYVGLNTNGTVNPDGKIRGLMEAGLDTLCFSIDGCRPETHERFRDNCPFGRVVEGIRAAVRTRREGGYATRISTNTVVHRGNVHELVEMSRFSRSLGADRSNFQPVLTGALEGDVLSELRFREEDVEMLEGVRAELRRLAHSNIGNYLDLVIDYCAGGSKVRDLTCYAGRAFAYVDPAGNLFPCSVMKDKLANLAEPGAGRRLDAGAVRETLRKAAAQKCPGCSLICYMERNVMLSRPLDPRMWHEVLVNRYRLWRGSGGGEREA